MVVAEKIIADENGIDDNNDDDDDDDDDGDDDDDDDDDDVLLMISRHRLFNKIIQRKKPLIHKLGFAEISPPQSLLPSNAQVFNLMLINLFIIVFILLVIYCVWQNNKIK